MVEKILPPEPPLAQSLENSLLVATPVLNDSPFEHTVAYICEHNSKGAVGIVINNPSKVSVSNLLRDLKLEHAISPATRRAPVLMGGPVAIEQGFVIYREQKNTRFKNPIRIGETISVSGSKDTLAKVAKAQRIRRNNMLVSLGCASWEPGQLEEELLENCWVLAPPDPEILFDLPFSQRWQAASNLIGVNFDRMAYEIGHA